MNERVIRNLIAATCELPDDPTTLSADADLYTAGLTSFASVQLMLALEQAFDIEFPDRLLNRKTFASIRNINDAIALIRAEQDAA